MFVIVDKLPKKPGECLFCQFPSPPEAGTILCGNCQFKVNRAKDWTDDLYSCGYANHKSCELYGSDTCPFLQEIDK